MLALDVDALYARRYAPDHNGLEEDLTRALACDALMDRAEDAQAKGKYTEALDALTQIIDEYATSSAQLLMERAEISVSLGNVFDGIADSGHALKLDATNIAWLQFRGQLFYQLGDAISLDAAVQHYRQALHSDPEHRVIKKEYRKVKNLLKKLKSIQNSMDQGKYVKCCRKASVCVDASL